MSVWYEVCLSLDAILLEFVNSDYETMSHLFCNFIYVWVFLFLRYSIVFHKELWLVMNIYNLFPNTRSSLSCCLVSVFIETFTSLHSLLKNSAILMLATQSAWDSHSGVILNLKPADKVVISCVSLTHYYDWECCAFSQQEHEWKGTFSLPLYFLTVSVKVTLLSFQMQFSLA